MSRRLTNGEPDVLETLHCATVPRLRIVKLRTEAVERRDDAATANNVEVRGHTAWNVYARA